LPIGADPDAAALAVSGLDRDQPPPGAVSHATSWRAAPGGELVLTYTALPDPASDQAVPLTAPSIICSNDPLRPVPDGLHAHHVAAHGARHLAYLARTDPAVGRYNNRRRHSWCRYRSPAHYESLYTATLPTAA
jgi:transposase InsO family protein